MKMSVAIHPNTKELQSLHDKGILSLLLSDKHPRTMSEVLIRARICKVCFIQTINIQYGCIMMVIIR